MTWQILDPHRGPPHPHHRQELSPKFPKTGEMNPSFWGISVITLVSTVVGSTIRLKVSTNQGFLLTLLQIPVANTVMGKNRHSIRKNLAKTTKTYFGICLGNDITVFVKGQKKAQILTIREGTKKVPSVSRQVDKNCVFRLRFSSFNDSSPRTRKFLYLRALTPRVPLVDTLIVTSIDSLVDHAHAPPHGPPPTLN